MNVVLVAEESAGVQALRLLTSRRERIAAVLTSSPAGRGTTVATVAEQLGVARVDPAAVRDPAFARWLLEREIDLLLNVHSLHLVDAAVLAAPRLGSYNLHPGPLPRYAGLNAPSWAILEGQTRHAVTVHRMVPAVDEGAIAYEAWFEIGPHDTGLRVAAACVRHGIPLLARLLDDAARGADQVPARAQAGPRRWYGRAAPYGGWLPWELPAVQVLDLVRAADYSPFPSPWGHPRAVLDGRELEVVAALATGEPRTASPGTVGAARDGGVAVAAGDEWVVVRRLRAEGRAVDPVEALTEGAVFKPKSSKTSEASR